MHRRKFLSQAALASAAAAFSPQFMDHIDSTTMPQAFENTGSFKKFRPKYKPGFGAVAIGNGFQPNPDIECLQSIDASWKAGIRYFDTSPWYGLGISERRLGLYLKDKPREEFTLSTKVGRILEPKENFRPGELLWKGKMNFGYRYDYSAAGVRRSIEESLQRMGLSSIDIVFIHDLSPDNEDMKGDWVRYFDEAAKGAMPELIKMREEGIIKGWGFGVNTIDPIIKAMEVSDPDIFLSACQYSLIGHEDDLNKVFPKAAEKDISIVVGAPLCSGLLAGKKRYMYNDKIPAAVQQKYESIQKVAARHKVDVRTAALQFAAAPDVVSAVIPGSHTVRQSEENAASFKVKIPADFWAEMKKEKLLAENAPVPKIK